MGYAIFTARKLMLTNRINQLNFRIMQLSQQQQTLAKAAGDKERQISWIKGMFNTIGNAFSQRMNIQTQAAIYQAQQGGGSMEDLQKLLSGSYAQQNIMGQMFQFAGMMIDYQSSNDLRSVKDMENQIELERKNLETQVQALTAERDSVEKAEENQIKNSAPKFA